MRRRALLAGGFLAVVAVVAATACGGSDGKETSVRLDEIRPAMAAVESSLGGPQRYSEVNATPSEVNVFVVRDGKDLAYVVRGDDVDAPVGGTAYAGPTFTAEQVVFSPGVLDGVEAALPNSPVVAFSVTPRQVDGVDYIATVRATGGELRVLLDASGTVLSTG